MQEARHRAAGGAVRLLEDVIQEEHERTALRPLRVVGEQHGVLAEDDRESRMVCGGEQFVREQVLPIRHLVLRLVAAHADGKVFAVRRREPLARNLRRRGEVLQHGDVLEAHPGGERAA